MAISVFIRDPNTGTHYRRSIWYRRTRFNDAVTAKNDWLDAAPDCQAILIEDSSEQGE